MTTDTPQQKVIEQIKAGILAKIKKQVNSLTFDDLAEINIPETLSENGLDVIPADVPLFLSLDASHDDFQKEHRKNQLGIQLEAIAGQLKKIAEEVAR